MVIGKNIDRFKGAHFVGAFFIFKNENKEAELMK